MSTAGKVLVVIVALVMVAWIILFSMVGQLNRNWGERVAAHEQEQAKLEPELAKAEDALDKALDEIDAVQVDKIHKTGVLRTDVEDREGLLARSREALSATKIRLEKSNATAEAAKVDLTRRQQEKAETEKSLAAMRAEVEQLKAQNTELLAKLTGLRDDFKRSLTENQDLLRRVAGSGPRVCPATFVTP